MAEWPRDRSRSSIRTGRGRHPLPITVGSPFHHDGLEPDDYLLETMPSMHFDALVANTPLRTVDKPRLLRDLTRDVTVERRNPEPKEAEEYDLVVDATGISRAFLPPCRSDLTLPTLQHRVAAEPLGDGRLEAGVYGNDVPGLGYTSGSSPSAGGSTTSASAASGSPAWRA